MNLVKSEDFPKCCKIRNASLINNLFNTGRKSRLKSVSIISAQNSLGHPRLGISVAKKSMPRAVDRNKLKRTFREFFRKNKQLIGPRDLLIICRQFNPEKIKSYKAEDILHYFKIHNEH